LNNSNKISFRSASNKSKKKLLPPLSKENTIVSSKRRSFESYRSVSQDLKRLHSPTVNNNSHFKKIDLNQTFSHQSSASSETNILLPLTDNKKKLPSKIKHIDQSVKLNATTLSGIDTPITIDILSESGRYSRQSLEPLSTNRYSSVNLNFFSIFKRFKNIMEVILE
jgi:hypothetical protein